MRALFQAGCDKSREWKERRCQLPPIRRRRISRAANYAERPGKKLQKEEREREIIRPARENGRKTRCRGNAKKKKVEEGKMWGNKFCLEALRSRQTNRTKAKNRKADACPTCTLIVIMAKDKCRRIILWEIFAEEVHFKRRDVQRVLNFLRQKILCYKRRKKKNVTSLYGRGDH